jgi:hypothetical protein
MLTVFVRDDFHERFWQRSRLPRHADFGKTRRWEITCTTYGEHGKHLAYISLGPNSLDWPRGTIPPPTPGPPPFFETLPNL